MGKKNFGLEKNLGQKKVQKFWSTKIKAFKKSGSKSLVKIRSVIAEILLIRTKVAKTCVAWTNVARTNVAKTVGICSICSQEPTFQVWSKSGLKQLIYS